MEIHEAILDLSPVYRSTLLGMTFINADCVINGKDVITYAQRIVGNGVIIIAPHDFKQLSRWYF
jgi:hypothetical protein